MPLFSMLSAEFAQVRERNTIIFPGACAFVLGKRPFASDVEREPNEAGRI